MKTKLFTEDDLRNAWKMAFEESFNKWVKHKKPKLFKSFIKSVKQPIETFTENDLRMAIKMARFLTVTDEFGSVNFQHTEEEIFNSLKQ
jgi:hypothetical protein